MKLHRLTLLAVAASLAFGYANAQTTVATDPVGFVTVNINPGTATTKRPTFFSIPLQEAESITGQVSGALTGVTSNSLVNSNAGWTAGALSVPATPYVVQITSGAAAGSIFLIASSANTAGASGSAGLSNTATTLFISPLDSARVNLTNIGVAVSNTYRIFACDTLGAFFGTPGTTGIRGGSAITNADSITTIINGGQNNYWYNTGVTPNRWSKQGPGSVDSANVALVPNYGVVYQKLGTNPLSFTVTGQVPVTAREASIKNSGLTLLSQYWPTTSTLSALGLQSLPIWTGGSSVSSADTVVLTATNGAQSTFWYDPSANSGSGGWRRQGPGNPVTNPVIGIGTAVQIFQRGSASGYTTLEQALPYNLN